MKLAQLIPWGNLSLLSESLKMVRVDSSACILYCVSNFICGTDESSSILSRIKLSCEVPSW